MNIEQHNIKNIIRAISDMYGKAMTQTASVVLRMSEVEQAYQQSKASGVFLVPILIQDCSVVIKFQPRQNGMEHFPIKVDITPRTITFSDSTSKFTDEFTARKVYLARSQGLIDATGTLLKDSPEFTLTLKNLCGGLYRIFQSFDEVRGSEFCEYSD